MKNRAFSTAFLFFLFHLLLMPSVQGASVKINAPSFQQEYSARKPAGKFHTAKTQQAKKGIWTKIKGWFQKITPKRWSKPGREQAKMYLFVCAGLVVLSIIAFALSRYGQVFSILGSLFAIGGAVFFIMWLLHFTNTI